MKIGLFLMTKKGFKVLESLITNKYSDLLGFVCIGQDVNIQEDYSKEISNLCINNKIHFFYRDSVNTHQTDCDYYIAISWRWIIQLPNLIVFHDSILPRYRGFAPLVNMLINGEDEIGVTALFATNEYDKGSIISQEKIGISYPLKIKKAINIVSELYSHLIIKIIFQLNSSNIQVTPQNENEASYSLWLSDDDYFIDWNLSAVQIKRKIDACGFPFNGAKSYMLDQVINISDVELEDDVAVENRDVGKVIFIKENQPIIVCGSGLLRVTKAHFEESKISILPLQKFRIKFG